MKKLFLIIAIFTLTTSINAQSTINTNNLIGYWEPNRHSSHLVFWKDLKGDLQIVEFSTGDGVPFKSSLIKVGETLVVTTYFEETNYYSTSEYSFIDDKTLKCTVTGEIEAVVLYTKVK